MTFEKILKLDITLIKKCENVFDIITSKINYGKHNNKTLLDNIIKPFMLFGSFDFYLQNFPVTEGFFYENFFKNLHFGINHFSQADSILNCFSLSNFISTPLKNWSLIKEPLDTTKIQNLISKDRLKFFGNLVKGNLIFPYNIYPRLLSSSTSFMLMSSEELSNMRFRTKNKSLFDSHIKLQNEELILNTDHSSRKNIKNFEKTFRDQKISFIYSIENANTRNGLLTMLMEPRSAELLRKQEILGEPLWFIEHLLSNLKDKKQGFEIFDYCFENWKEMGNEVLNPIQEENVDKLYQMAHLQKQFCRIQASCLTIIDFLLTNQSKKIEDLVISLTEKDKIKIKKELYLFESIQGKIHQILNKIVNGEQQVTLLTYSNEKYILWAQSLHQGIKKYNFCLLYTSPSPRD